MKGSGKQVAAEMVQIASPTLKETTKSIRIGFIHSIAASRYYRLLITVKTSLLETLVNLPLSTRVLHRNTSLEVDVKLAPIPVLSQQQVFTSPLSIFLPLPSIHTPSSGEKEPTAITITNNKSLLLLKQNMWIHFSSCLGVKFHIFPAVAHCHLKYLESHS